MTVKLIKKKADFKESELRFVQRVEDFINTVNLVNIQYFQDSAGIINKAIITYKDI